MPNATIDRFYRATLCGVGLAYIFDSRYLRSGDAADRIGIGLMLAICVAGLFFRRFAKVESDKETVSSRVRPLLLDSSVAIDGRIADVAATGLLDGSLVVPKFVVDELQAIADSDDKQRRTRGRRGLDVLNRLHAAVDSTDLPTFSGRSVDEKLVLLAKHLKARLMTTDFNLNKVAQLQGIAVVNLNDLAKALRPVCLPGDRLTLQLAKPGEQAGQGVGYLDDGTMVVVEGGREYVGCSATIVVTTVTQSSAGRMVFGRFEALAV